MNAKKITEIQKKYREFKSHKDVKEFFGLNDAEVYAINIFGRDKKLSPDYLASKIDNVKDGMTIGEVAVALGFEAEAALEVGK